MYMYYKFLSGCKDGANWKGSFGHWHQGREGMI